MITTDEPGVYKEGKYGIRLENELLCVESAKLLAFRPLTLCPFDREAILPELLTAEELAYLNSYQQAVCEILAPLLEPQAAAWLREATARIG